jgi:3-isopropylmalate/(R)-2-methylmalate dehydratase small subunit
MKMLQGYAHVYGDHIDTDRIIAGKYTKTLALERLAAHVLEDLDPSFVQKLRPGDFLVAGENFGCGSSREQAPLALLHSGVAAVVATSFSRLFFRNAINVGLPIFEIGAHKIKNGNKIMIDLKNSTVYDHTDDRKYQLEALPPLVEAICKNGGLIGYLSRCG